METAFSGCKLWEIVDGTESKPSDIDTEGKLEWEEKDTSALALIYKCCKTDVLINIANTNTSKGAWDVLASEYSQTGSRSGNALVPTNDQTTWIRQQCFCTCNKLSRSHLPSCQCQLYYARTYIGCNFPLTLPTNPKDPELWNNHIAGVRIYMEMTSLSSVINGILKEKCHLTEDNPAVDSANAALERATCKCRHTFCNNCNCKGHHTDNYWEKGGRKEGQEPGQKKGKGGKEKAYTTNGRDNEEDVNSSLVKFE